MNVISANTHTQPINTVCQADFSPGRKIKNEHAIETDGETEEEEKREKSRCDANIWNRNKKGGWVVGICKRAHPVSSVVNKNLNLTCSRCRCVWISTTIWIYARARSFDISSPPLAPSLPFSVTRHPTPSREYSLERYGPTDARKDPHIVALTPSTIWC